VTLLICCLPGVLFLRGAAVPQHVCRILPPVLSVAVDHAGGAGVSASAGDAERHPQAALPRTALVSAGSAGPNRAWLRSELLDIALPPPQAV
jgi:hypothetical protein